MPILMVQGQRLCDQPFGYKLDLMKALQAQNCHIAWYKISSNLPVFYDIIDFYNNVMKYNKIDQIME